MSIRVIAYDDTLRAYISVHVVSMLDTSPGLGSPRRLGLMFMDGLATWIDCPEGAELPTTYAFSYEVAPLLFNALKDIYEPENDMRVLRKDVDRLTEAVSNLILQANFDLSEDSASLPEEDN